MGQDDSAISLAPNDPKGSARERPAVANISIRPPPNDRYNAKVM